MFPEPFKFKYIIIHGERQTTTKTTTREKLYPVTNFSSVPLSASVSFFLFGKLRTQFVSGIYGLKIIFDGTFLSNALYHSPDIAVVHVALATTFSVLISSSLR